MYRKSVISLLAALVWACASLWAQQSASSGIGGQVMDSTQAALPGAMVTVTNIGTSAQRTAITDAQGNFSVPNLPQALY